MNEGAINGLIPVMEVYVISNGYLLAIKNIERQMTTVIYAKDEIGIAEEIIAAQARHKLDIKPKQGEMFSPEEMGQPTLNHNLTRRKKK